MDCGKTRNQRKTRKDGMEKLETRVARKSIPAGWYRMLRMKKPSNRNRSRFEIIAEILRKLREPTCMSNIMSHCNLSSTQFGQYLNFMKSRDLIRTNATARKVTYNRTENGREFLKLFNKMVLLLDSSISPASLIAHM